MLRKITVIGFALIVATSGIQGQAPAVQNVSPFDVVGFIESATVDTPGDVFSGGTIRLNGVNIIVPRNTVLQMPATSLTWQEVFALAPQPYKSANQSGLAITDTPRPMTTYEVHVQGNRVGNTYIAGLLFIAQQSLNSGQGTINYIDYAAGELRVGGVIGDKTSGARVRLNDPIGRFGRTMSPDVRFTIDEENPTVRSQTAYPMCLPRFDPASQDDPDCPKQNRPVDPNVPGGHLTIINMPDPADPNTLPTDPNAWKFAPFEIGDFVTYSGELFNDDAGLPYISANTVLDNVGLFTAPGALPRYVAMDVILLGVGGIPDPTLPQEATVRTRVEGFTTDPSWPIDIFAVDVDACSGAESDRYYDTASVEQVAPLGRFRFRPQAIGTFLPPTREIHVVSEAGDPVMLDNGMMAGEYTAPNFTFLFPENLGVGNLPVPLNFQDFPFLANGSGPYYGFGASATAPSLGTVGQLSPWPGATAPAKVACTATSTVRPPIANAGVNQFVKPGDTVTLDGSKSFDPNRPVPRKLTYTWTTPSGIVVTPIVDPKTLLPTGKATFKAPALNAVTKAPIVLPWTLTVNNGLLSSSANVTVTVSNPPIPPDVVAVTTATFRIRRSRLTVTATTTNPNAVLTLQGFGPLGPGVPVAPGVPVPPGTFQIIIVGVNPAPRTVTVTSSAGGSATLAVTVVP